MHKFKLTLSFIFVSYVDTNKITTCSDFLQIFTRCDTSLTLYSTLYTFKYCPESPLGKSHMVTHNRVIQIGTEGGREYKSKCDTMI